MELVLDLATDPGVWQRVWACNYDYGVPRMY
jgi:hypothetical protein